MTALRVMVVGAAGRMGREVVRAVSAAPDLALVAAVDRVRVGEDAVRVAGAAGPAVPLCDSLRAAIQEGKPEAAVDFTLPTEVMANARAAIAAKLPYVVGTSGLKEPDLEELAALCEQHSTPALVVPNFALGAVLMMQFAAQAARYFPAAEVIELHHSDKIDSPSGTARATAKLLAEAGASSTTPPSDQPARGLTEQGIQIHSVRLPGLVAHQEVIFGGLGQTLTIRHDSISRESFMPGVLLALRKVRELKGLVVGLERVM
jgi:4-hydroxy-tetrahydrodipicolinate reductase